MIRPLSHPGAGLPWPRSLMWAMAEVGLTDDELTAAVGISASSLVRYRRGCVPGQRSPRQGEKFPPGEKRPVERMPMVGWC